SEETIVGRRRDCDLRIRSSEVSRRHCLLSFQDGVLHVEDLDSVNGTFVNGVRVSGRQVVRPGDRLDVGPIQFLVEYALSREAGGSVRSRTTFGIFPRRWMNPRANGVPRIRNSLE